MASTKEYFAFIREQLSGLESVSFRAMMGEYIIYCDGKVVGGIYDDRLLVKAAAAARKLMPDAAMELPYEGAKEMVLVDEVDDPAFLQQLLTAVAAELPEPRKRRRNS